MSDFDDFAAANQGGLRPARRPGDAVLRARARTHDTEEDWTRGAGLAPPPQKAPKRPGGLVDGIAAYKQMAGRKGLAETKPVAAPIGATRTPSVRDGAKPSGAPANRAPTGPRPNAKWGADRVSGAGSVGDLGGATGRVGPKPRSGTAGTDRKTPAGPFVPTDPTPRPRPSKMISMTVPDSRSPGAVDGLITEIMRFAETLTGVDPQQKHDRVAEIWSP